MSREVVGLASDYNAIRVRAGQVNGPQIKKDIEDIFTYDQLSAQNRQALHEVAILKGKGDYKQACKLLKTMSESQKSNPKIAVELAQALIESKELKQAKEVLQGVLAEFPKDPSH